MMMSRSVMTMFGLVFSTATLVVFTGGCCMFSECGTAEAVPPAPAPAAAVAEKEVKPAPAPAVKESPKPVVKVEAAVPKKEEATKPVAVEKKAEPVKPAAPVAAKNVTLENAVWTLKLDTLKGVDKSWEEPMKNITLVYVVKTNQISGCSGVNRYFGPATVDTAKGVFKPGNLGVTRMAGHGMQYEDLYLKTLNKVDSYTLKDGLLTLMAGTEPVMVFISGVQETK